MAQSLFKACRTVGRNKQSSVQNIGGYNAGIEYYTQEDIDANILAIEQGQATKCTFGDSDQSKIVLVFGDVITVPENFVLSPASPKKSLVIFCNKLVNNGTISMTGKGPNVLPHKYFILGKGDGWSDDITIPAYANNAVISDERNTKVQGKKGNSGNARNCASGGTGVVMFNLSGTGRSLGYCHNSGSGYAFGGGAGSGGSVAYGGSEELATKALYDVSTEYPMRASNGYTCDGNWSAFGGVGNPAGSGTVNVSSRTQNSGVGGRLIIYCNDLDNQGTIEAKGVDTQSTTILHGSNGGASGGGAIDIFCNTVIEYGEVSAAGGHGCTASSSDNTAVYVGGDGGDGCVTLSEWAFNPLVREAVKKFSKDNWAYLFSGYISRFNEEV